jgi:hypothetical protein
MRPVHELCAHLEHLVDKHGVAYAAFFTADGAMLAEAGSRSALVHEGLVSALLGPQGSASKTYASLEGQVLPQSYAQGGDTAIVDRAAPGVGAAYFIRAGNMPAKSPVEGYWWSKALAAEGRAPFERPGTAD